MRPLRILGLLVGSLLVNACTTPAPTRLAGDDCARWFAHLDAAVDAAGLRDAQEARIDGYAGLRVDRFGAATRRSVAFDVWFERAAELDRRAREAEIANLPRAAFPIDGITDAAAARARSDSCRAASATSSGPWASTARAQCANGAITPPHSSDVAISTTPI